uniref:Uncharacterized protein n=1 Tax=Chrysotila carterae TaxID=13221 RepID=A0A7S4EU37_CHRCT
MSWHPQEPHAVQLCIPGSTFIAQPRESDADASTTEAYGVCEAMLLVKARYMSNASVTKSIKLISLRNSMHGAPSGCKAAPSTCTQKSSSCVYVVSALICRDAASFSCSEQRYFRIRSMASCSGSRHHGHSANSSCAHVRAHAPGAGTPTPAQTRSLGLDARCSCLRGHVGSLVFAQPSARTMDLHSQAQ